jgi:hypothetical protein
VAKTIPKMTAGAVDTPIAMQIAAMATPPRTDAKPTISPIRSSHGTHASRAIENAVRRIAPKLTALVFVFAIYVAPKPTTAVFTWAVQQRAASITRKLEKALLRTMSTGEATTSTSSLERHRP